MKNIILQIFFFLFFIFSTIATFADIPKSNTASSTINLPLPGNIGDILSVQVTGETVPSSFFLPLALKAIEKSINLQDNAYYKIDYDGIRSPLAVKKYKTAVVIIPVILFGTGYQRITQEIPVKIENVLVEFPPKCKYIFVSNSPENITTSGKLLEASLEARELGRLLIHHKNNTRTNTMNFVISLTNITDLPAKIYVISGGIRTSKDEIFLGHTITARFFKNLADGFGRIIEVGPRETIVMSTTKVLPQTIICTISEIGILTKGKIRITVNVIEKHSPILADGINIGDYSSTIRSHGVFSPPYIKKVERYTVGEKWKFIMIGAEKVKSINNGENLILKGNYGVMYDFDFILSNSSNTSEIIEFLFFPSAGPARGTFIIDDKFFETRTGIPPDKLKILNFTLPPDSEKKINVKTMPEPGAYYPVRLILRSKMSQLQK